MDYFSNWSNIHLNYPCYPELAIFNVISFLYEYNFNGFIEDIGKDKIIISVLGIFPSKEDLWNKSFIHNHPFM